MLSHLRHLADCHSIWFSPRRVFRPISCHWKWAQFSCNKWVKNQLKCGEFTYFRAILGDALVPWHDAFIFIAFQCVHSVSTGIGYSQQKLLSETNNFLILLTCTRWVMWCLLPEFFRFKLWQLSARVHKSPVDTSAQLFVTVLPQNRYLIMVRN